MSQSTNTLWATQVAVVHLIFHESCRNWWAKHMYCSAIHLWAQRHNNTSVIPVTPQHICHTCHTTTHLSYLSHNNTPIIRTCHTTTHLSYLSHRNTSVYLSHHNTSVIPVTPQHICHMTIIQKHICYTCRNITHLSHDCHTTTHSSYIDTATRPSHNCQVSQLTFPGMYTMWGHSGPKADRTPVKSFSNFSTSVWGRDRSIGILVRSPETNIRSILNGNIIHTQYYVWCSGTTLYRTLWVKDTSLMRTLSADPTTQSCMTLPLN